MHFSKLFLTLATLVTLLLPLSSYAQDAEDDKQYVTFRALAERAQVKAGEEIWIAVEQSIAPEWHTYWKNPGDSGAAPRHDWEMPEGFTIGEINWPVPSRLPYPPLMNFGYSENVVLLQKLKIPDVLPEGKIELGLMAEALVCKDICIPAFGELTLALNDPMAMDEDNSAYFEQALERLPETADWKADFLENGGDLVVNIALPNGFAQNVDLSSVALFPADWGFIDNAAAQSAMINDNILTLTQKRGDRDLSAIENAGAVLAFNDADGARRGVKFNMVPAGALETAAQTSIQTSENTSAADDIADTGLIKAIILALLGGLVLNLMPCVFPVLSLKALSLVKISEKSAGLARIHGLTYTLGVISSFLLIAGALILLQAGGQQIGWGFQLQSPLVIALLAYLLFVIGLNLAGFFDIAASFGNVGEKLTRGSGLTSSFFTGVLATVVATPCTAPFMGIALGYAALQPPLVSLSIFAALGFGLALPYLALSFVPALQKSLPRPGAWMDVFKQALAFPMFAFAAWLVWILAQQSGAFGVFGVLLGMIAIAFALWLGKHIPRGALAKALVRFLILLSVFVAIATLPVGQRVTSAPVSASMEAQSETFGKPFSPSALQTALSGNNPVFVEMTAAWCITCKVNHATSINIASTKKVFADKNVEYLVGDWTNQDTDITQYLKSFGRNGVPIYVYYGAPDANSGKRPDPVVLPQLLTPGILASAIQ
jgi:thiol:disulfide interchange protein/DsbC/DsbD-like thiol-disulfide interchange protein